MTNENKAKEKKESNLFGIFEHPLIPNNVEEILSREVIRIGNSGHISIPAKHLGKKARVIIYKKEGVPDK